MFSEDSIRSLVKKAGYKVLDVDMIVAHHSAECFDVKLDAGKDELSEVFEAVRSVIPPNATLYYADGRNPAKTSIRIKVMS